MPDPPWCTKRQFSPFLHCIPHLPFSSLKMADPPLGSFARRCDVDLGEDDSYLSVVFYHNDLQPKELGEKVPSAIPHRDEIFLLLDVVGPYPRSFQRLMEWVGVRYALLLEWNLHVSECKENLLLAKFYKILSTDGDIKKIRRVQDACMQLFWPFLQADFLDRLQCSTNKCKVKDELRYEEGPVCVKVCTSPQGDLIKLEHNERLNNFGRGVENPFPELKVWKQSQIQHLSRIHDFVARVRIEKKEYCCKRLRWGNEDSFVQELRALHVAAGHPNIMKLSGVVEGEDGLIVGILTPFLMGSTLEHVQAATPVEKVRWKKQLKSALEHLHCKSLLWEDGKPDNIFITVDRELFLFDFDVGRTFPYVPPPELFGTKDGDLHVLQLVFDFIDNIPE